MGRKKKEISPAQLKIIESYALDGCKNGTICAMMDWDPQWLDGRKDILKRLSKKRAERKHKLLMAQSKRASAGSDTMLIWLGKQELEQSDRNEHKHIGDIKVQLVQH